MAQWVLGAIAVSMIAGVFSAKKVKTDESVMVMIAIVVAALLAWTRFRGVQKPFWIYGIVLFAPAGIVLIDRLVGERIGPRSRVLLAGILAGMSLGSVIFESLGSSTAEEW
jgi:uncharacterized membrane protein